MHVACRQRVRIPGTTSEWPTINRGVPQGSVLGPLLFNIFVNDLFYVKINGQIMNYADDNHLCNANINLTDLQCDMEKDADSAVIWFNDNNMAANPDKFQTIVMSKPGGEELPLTVMGNDISVTHEIISLGVTLDDKLYFKSHVTTICHRASRQINSFKRFAKLLTEEKRLMVYKCFILSNFLYLL